MKEETKMLILFCSVFAIIIGWWIHSLAYNGWKQNPVPRFYYGDSVLRPYFDSAEVCDSIEGDSIKFKTEPR